MELAFIFVEKKKLLLTLLYSKVLGAPIDYNQLRKIVREFQNETIEQELDQELESEPEADEAVFTTQIEEPNEVVPPLHINIDTDTSDEENPISAGEAAADVL